MQGNSVNPYAKLNQKADFALHDLENASFEERAAAYTIDMLFIGILTKGFTTVGAPAGFGVFLPLFYYIVCHYQLGQTLGKKLLGLHVISDEQNQPLTYKQIAKRETFGRFLSAVGFGAGYLAVMFSEERRAWHDKFSKTRVVSFRASQTSVATQVVRGLGSIAVLALVVVAGIIGVLGFSSYPLKSLQGRLMMMGVHMQGIHGSLYSGFRVDRVHWQDAEDSMELEGLELDFTSMSDLLGGEKLQIAKIGVSQGYIRSMKPKKPKSAVPDEEAEEAGKKEKKSVGIPQISVEEMDIQNLVYETPDNKFQLKRLFVANFETKKGLVQVERVYVDSSDFIFNIPQVSLENDELKMSNTAEAIIKPTVYPTILKSDFDLKLKAQGSLNDPSLNGEAFQKKLTFNRGLTGFNLELQDWSPGHYLRGHWPVTRMYLKIRGQGDLLKSLMSADLEGALSIYQVPFRLVPGQTAMTALTRGLELRHERGGYQSQMLIVPSRYNKGTWAYFRSNFQLPTQAEELALLIHGRAWGALNPEERDMIVKDLSFFQSPLLRPEVLKGLDMRAPASQ